MGDDLHEDLSHHPSGDRAVRKVLVASIDGCIRDVQQRQPEKPTQLGAKLLVSTKACAVLPSARTESVALCLSAAQPWAALQALHPRTSLQVLPSSWPCSGFLPPAMPACPQCPAASFAYSCKLSSTICEWLTPPPPLMRCLLLVHVHVHVPAAHWRPAWQLSQAGVCTCRWPPPLLPPTLSRDPRHHADHCRSLQIVC